MNTTTARPLVPLNSRIGSIADRGRFVVGTGRCGTTLVCHILSAHPDCLGINETHWVPRVYAAGLAGYRDPNVFMDCVESTFHVGGNPVFAIPPEIAEHIRSSPHPVTAKLFCNALLAEIAAYHRAAIWVDKTPDYCCHVPVLRLLWPGARFLHVTRDPYWAALSMSRHPGYQALIEQGATEWCSLSHRRDIQRPRSPTSKVEPYLRLWARRIEACRIACSDLPDDQYLEVSFESLLEGPKAVIRKLYCFFDLSPDEDFVNAAVKLVHPDRVANRLGMSLPPDLPKETQTQIKTYRQKNHKAKKVGQNGH